jgi:hypothetical protein
MRDLLERLVKAVERMSRRPQFVRTDMGVAVNLKDISHATLLDASIPKVLVFDDMGCVHTCTENNAIEALMSVKASLLEGHRMKWAKNAWVVHNVIGHPVMQLLALAGHYDLAMKVHDLTIPKPTHGKSR